MNAPSFHELSPWLSEPEDRRAPLLGHTRADVAIVGGGYTGLSTALALRESGLSVALVEQDFCGSGASGRNAGHLTPTIGKDLPTLLRHFGEQRTGDLVGFAEEAVKHTEKTIVRLSLDCDYRPVGNVIAGLHARHRPPLERAARVAEMVGAPFHFLDEADVRARDLPQFVKFGAIEASGGHLHPGKYVQGLRRAVLQAGVELFEDTSVTSIERKGSRVHLRTASGSLDCERLVLATNAYTPSTLGRMAHRVFPLRVSLFRTRPLSAAEWDRLGWARREGIYTAHESLENFRPLPDGRILGGSKVVQYAFGSKLAPGSQPSAFQTLADLFRKRFPELRDVAIEDFWGGWIAMTLDFLPFFDADKSDRIVHAMGYNGHGIAQATFAGSMAADLVMGRRNRWVELLRRHSLPLPPEPFRWLGVKALLGYLGRIDAKVDRNLSRP